MSKKEKNVWSNPAILVAIFGFLGVVIAALITGYFGYRGTVRSLEIAAAQTQQAMKIESPTAIAQTRRDWYVLFVYEFPAGYWKEGMHKYYFKAVCPFGINSTGVDEPTYSLTVKQDTEPQKSTVYIRRGGLYLTEILGASYGDTLHPSQTTTAIYSPFATTFEDAERLRDECVVQMRVDDGEFIDLHPVGIDKSSD